MKKRRFGLFLSILFIITLTACVPGIHYNKKVNSSLHTEESSSPERESGTAADESVSDREAGESAADDSSALESSTMMIYMVGSNLESEYALASREIEEILDAEITEDNFRLLLCTGGSKMWWKYDIPNDACAVYEVKGGELHPLTELKGKNMSEPETLTEFMDYGYEHYPSDSYSLVLWNHGAGSMLGYGADENYDFQMMSTVEMGKALEGSALSKDGHKLEWMGFDACLMGMVEVAHTLTPYVRYMVASEEVESGNGWDYACLEDLSKPEYFHGRKAGKAIVSSYEEYYQNKRNFKNAPDMTLSCLDLNETGTVEAALNELVAAAGEELAQGGYSRIARMRQDAKAFGIQSTDASLFDSVDLYDLAIGMGEDHPNESKKLQKALDSFIVENTTNTEGSHGVAIYFPYENKDYASQWTTSYDKLGFSKEYSAFIKTFTKTLSGDSLAQWDISEEQPRRLEEQPGYYVQLTPEQVQNYGKSYDSIWEDIGEDGDFICWYRSTDVTLQKDGKLTSRFNGDYYVLVDADGSEAPCMMVEIERTGTYTKFAIPLVLYREFDTTTAYAHVRVDEKNPDGTIIGLYESLDAKESLLPPKRTIELQKGDILTAFLLCRQIQFDEQGNATPFSTWKHPNMRGFDMTLTSGELRLEKRPFDKDGKYYCLFQITDTQGNKHESDLVARSE